MSFGGSCANFTIREFTENALKMYTDEEYWNQCLKISENILKKNENEDQLGSNLKQAIVKSELAAYEGRSRSVYEE